MVRIHPDPPGAAIAQVASQSRRAGATCTEHVHEVPSNEEWRSERGCSSVGRAPALQAGGRRFDPVHLHQLRAGRPGLRITYRLPDSTQRWALRKWARQSSALRAVVFFNNWEGKGSCDLMRVVWTLGLRCILPITFKRGLWVAQTRHDGETEGAARVVS